MQTSMASQLWKIGRSYTGNGGGSVDPTMKAAAIESMSNAAALFTTDVIALNFDGRNCSMMGQPGGKSYRWSIFGSMLFATTIFTTVGTSERTICIDTSRKSVDTLSILPLPHHLIQFLTQLTQPTPTPTLPHSHLPSRLYLQPEHLPTQTPQPHPTSTSTSTHTTTHQTSSFHLPPLRNSFPSHPTLF